MNARSATRHFQYRLVERSDDGSILEECFAASSDAEAARRALSIVGGGALELWRDGRLLLRFEISDQTPAATLGAPAASAASGAWPAARTTRH